MEKKGHIDTTYSTGERFDNLNEIPIQIIEHARTLNDEILALEYLSDLVTNENESHLRGFIQSVVTNKEQHETWGRGGVVLVLQRPYQELLTTERTELFNRSNADFKQVMPLDFEAWSQNSGIGGIFAFDMPGANYRSEAPEGYFMHSSSDIDLITIEESQVEIQYRRWLASNLAGYLRHYEKLSPDGISILDEIVDRKEWTTDALTALDGLLLELNAGVPENSIPGFTGSDDYYR